MFDDDWAGTVVQRTPRRRPGEWFAPFGGEITGAEGSLGQNTALMVQPWRADSTFTLGAVAIEVMSLTNAVSGNQYHFAVYQNDFGLPNRLLATGATEPFYDTGYKVVGGLRFPIRVGDVYWIGGRLSWPSPGGASSVRVRWVNNNAMFARIPVSLAWTQGQDVFTVAALGAAQVPDFFGPTSATINNNSLWQPRQIWQVAE